MKRINSRGFTLVETLIAAGILVASSLVVVSALDHINDIQKLLNLQKYQTQAALSFVESIRFDPTQYQINFNNAPDKIEEFLKPEQLPYGLANGSVYPREKCAECEVYMGFVITPSPLMMSLLQVKFRFYNRKENSTWDTSYFFALK